MAGYKKDDSGRTLAVLSKLFLSRSTLA